MAKELKTDYNDLRKFANDLLKFCDDLGYDVEVLRRETDNITYSSWRGEQADRFNMVVQDNSDNIKKHIQELIRLADSIKKSADALEQARNVKIG